MFKYVVDSQMNRQTALAQNPQHPAAQEVLDVMIVATVAYLGFDGAQHEGQIVMHKNAIEETRQFFAEALRMQFPIKSVIPVSDERYRWDDERSCDDNNSSGFNYRYIAGTRNLLSKHARGMAFDINPAQNVYIRYDLDKNEVFRSPAFGIYSEKAPGTLSAAHPLVLLMKKSGWTWGGDWTPESGRVDYQHFEKEVSTERTC